MTRSETRYLVCYSFLLPSYTFRSCADYSMGFSSNCGAGNMNVTGEDRRGQERTRADSRGHFFVKKVLDRFSQERGLNQSSKLESDARQIRLMSG